MKFYLFLALCITAASSHAKTSMFSVMAYNVENLFDNVHDSGKEDWTYLPKSKKQTPEVQAYCNKITGGFKDDCFNIDWSDKALDAKLKNIANAILQVNSGRGPDILIVEEVENLRILKVLAEQYLQKGNYKTAVLIEGDDTRGIDVGVISRFDIAESPRLHRIEFTREKEQPKTRGILEVPLKLPSGETVYVFGGHFPSQSHPTQQRIDAVNTLDRLFKSKGPNALYIAGGDFNITRQEDASAKLLNGFLSEQYLVSHVVGCASCRGTQVYKGGWSFLDVLIFSQLFAGGEKGSFVLDVSSINTPNKAQEQTYPDGSPKRFNYGNNTGISDHLPMYAELIVRSAPLAP